MRWLVMLIATGCIEPRIVECSDGLSCPAELACDNAHHGCVDPTQLAVCAGQPDETDCTAAGITGGCFSGVCLTRGCGNGIVEPGEVCDDGNRVSGDGCRGDCLSNETCGNGQLDVGEQCDDGNLMSRDGCDSKCIIEHPVWSAIALAPAEVRSAAYDVARARLVSPYFDGIWELSGLQWTFTLTPSFGPTGAIYYDTDRASTVVFATGPGGAQLYAWDGTALTAISNGTPPLAVMATYDGVNHRPIVIGGAPVFTAWTLDANGAWVQLASPPSAPPPSSIAFDVSSGDVVVIAGGNESDFDGSQWTTHTAAVPSGAGTLSYDATLGQLDYLLDAAFFVRTAPGVWANGAMPTCADPGASNQRPFFVDASGDLDVVSYFGRIICTGRTSWITQTVPAPAFVVATLASLHGGLAMIDSEGQEGNPPVTTWSWDGSWHALSETSSPPARLNAFTAFDPRRGASVLVGGGETVVCGEDDCPPAPLTDAWAFDGVQWSQLDDFPAAANPGALAFEPELARTVFDTGPADGRWDLDSNTTMWSSDPALSDVPPLSVAWHAIAGMMIATTGTDIFGLDTDGVWTELPLSPHGSYQAFADARTGGVLFVDSAATTVWELRGTTWISYPPLPAQGNNMSFAYLPSTGQLVASGQYVGFGYGSVAFVLNYASATPLESCTDNKDDDGDGLVGCADPDCWWACTPACPPYTTCPQ